MSSLISHKFHFAFIGHPSFTQVTHNLKISTLTLEEEEEEEVYYHIKWRAANILISSLICIFDVRICQKLRSSVALWATHLIRGAWRSAAYTTNIAQ